MVRVLLAFFTTISIYGQNYNISIYGISVAKAELKITNNKLELDYVTNGLADLIWPANNNYSTQFDTSDFSLIKFTKNINQGTLKQSITINIENNLLVYDNKFRKRPELTHNLFSMLAQLIKNYSSNLDTKWLNVEHEGALLKGRFISAGLDTLDLNGKNIICDYFRIDFKQNGSDLPFYDETDRLMIYSVNENTVRQIWVERNGNSRIIKASILANGFPFNIEIKND